MTGVDGIDLQDAGSGADLGDGDARHRRVGVAGRIPPDVHRIVTFDDHARDLRRHAHLVILVAERERQHFRRH